MRIERLAVRGVLRFTDLVSLDFRDLPAGLIAIVGENGAGKTTILEAPIAGLYRQFPSRQNEVLDYAGLTDSFIETSFELEGQGLYRARLNLDGPHRKADAVLQRILPDGTAAFLNDGKVTTFDAAIRELLPPPELLLASVFAAQNRAGSFITSDRKSRKQLFAVLLGLEVYERYAERARQASGLLAQALTRLQATRDVLARDAGAEVERALAARAEDLQRDASVIEQQRRELARELAAIEQRLTGLTEAATEHAAARVGLDRLDTERAMHERGRADLARQLADDAAHRAELARIQRTRDETIADADERIANNRTLLAERAAIDAAVARVQTTGAWLTSLRAEQAERHAEERRSRAQEATLQSRLHTIAQTERDLDRARLDTEILQTVPCHGVGDYAGCQFLSSARAASGRIGDLVRVVAQKAAVAGELASVRTGVQEALEEVQRLAQGIAEAEAQQAAAQKVAARAEHLKEAERRIEIWQQKKVEADQHAETARAHAGEREAARIADLRTRLDQAAEALRRLQDERAGLQAAVDRTAEASALASEQQALLNLKRRDWDATTAALARVHADLDVLARQRETLQATQQELAATEVRIATLTTDQTDWDRLARCFSRDGLQTLEIDLAGPAVSDLTNDLLEAAYGPRWRVDLVTQEPKASKGKDGSTHKEIFELKIYDAAHRAEARDLSDLSGGEQIVVDEALKSAIAIFVNRRYAHPIRTMWRDETTGALDGDNAMRYLAMLRKVHELGGFHQTLFITHNPDAAALADAQIVVSGGRIEPRFPPFAAAA